MMQAFCGSRGVRSAFVLTSALSVLLFLAQAQAQFTLQRISVDTLTNSDSVHKTEVEPDMFAWGPTMVTTFHVARRPGSVGWGSGDVGFSTSTNGGKTWTYGLLPDLTVNYEDGKYGAAADPSVGYDAKHGVWLISTLPLVGLQCCQLIGDVAVSRSTDGLHWSSPIKIDTTHLDDKNWTVCDNHPKSPFYGHCYTEWDQAFGSGEVLMSVSSDGGKTWGPGLASADGATGLGGEPVVQPNGTVIVPFQNGGINAFRSTNGGKSWSTTVSVATIDAAFDAGDIRNPDLPSVGIDGGGKVFAVWSDCRFRSGCPSNDIVMSTSSNGVTWSSVSRIPIDSVSSTVDHFLPGVGVDPATLGKTGHLTIVYYYYPVANCAQCQLEVGFTTSQDGGKTWTAGKKLAGPMQLTWLPLSDNGYMVADYIGVSYTSGNPFGVFAVATPPSTDGTLHEAMYTTKEPLLAAPNEPQFSSKGEMPADDADLHRKTQFYYDDEGKRAIPPEKLIRGKN